jgi:hypothetical protein
VLAELTIINMVAAANCWITNCVTTYHHQMLMHNMNQLLVLQIGHCTFVHNTLFLNNLELLLSMDFRWVNTAGENLIQDNIITDQHTGPYILQNGAAGNVVAYNVFLRAIDNAMRYGCISHGGIANYNLWEGNVVTWLAADSYRDDLIIIRHSFVRPGNG